VRVYSSTSITGAPLRTITFKGTSTVGLSVATAQLDAGPGEEIVVSALTGAPLIKIFSGSSGALLALHNKAGLGFAAGYKQGARVAVADTDEDGRFELLLAPGAGAVPSLRVLELGATLGAPPTELFSVLAQDAFTGFTVATL
jgi:GT2 family glycosyltransferase